MRITTLVQYVALSCARGNHGDIIAFGLKSHTHTAHIYDAFVPVEIVSLRYFRWSEIKLKLLLCVVKWNAVFVKSQIDLVPSFGSRVTRLIMRAFGRCLFNGSLFVAKAHEAFVFCAQR